MFKSFFKHNEKEQNPKRKSESSAAQTGEAPENSRFLTFMAPITGTLVPIEGVDDPVFSQKMVGDGVAVQPDTHTVIAPVGGTLTNMFPTGHAAGITTPEGIEVLVHIGLDTVELKGEGFKILAEQGQTVAPGTPLIELNLEQLRKTARSTVSPIIITNMNKVLRMEKTSQEHVQAGLDWVLRVQLQP